MPWFVKIEVGIVDKLTFDQYVEAHKTYVRELITKIDRYVILVVDLDPCDRNA